MPDDRLPQTNQEALNLNFLDRKLVLDLKHNPATILQYPDITPEDFVTKRERYRILLGKVDVASSNLVHVSLDAILELQEGDLPKVLEVKEGEGEITNVNLQAIRELFETMKARNTELKDLEFIGEMHTHPVLLKEGDENSPKPWHPSQNDVDNIVRNYTDGTLDKKKPFVFGIAGPDEHKKTQYAFYRLIFEDGKYKVEKI